MGMLAALFAGEPEAAAAAAAVAGFATVGPVGAGEAVARPGGPGVVMLAAGRLAGEAAPCWRPPADMPAKADGAGDIEGEWRLWTEGEAIGGGWCLAFMPMPMPIEDGAYEESTLR